jgi:hypothetical protein
VILKGPSLIVLPIVGSLIVVAAMALFAVIGSGPRMIELPGSAPVTF